MGSTVVAARRFAFALLRGVARTIPPGLSERLWLAVLSVRPAVPKELLARRGDSVVQVGTPKPETIRRLQRIVGREGKVVVIEPEPATVQRQADYLRSQSLANVVLVPKAAWNERATRTLLIADRPGDHRLDMDAIVHDNDLVAGGYRGRTEVEADTLDNILDEAGVEQAAFVEIAVNGAELQVLEGMERSLGRTWRLFVKGHARSAESGEPINARIEEILRARGFRTKRTRPTRSRAESWGPREGDVFAWRPRR
jgi:FkbM family methyltransferase